MVNIRTIHSVTCYYLPLSGSLTSAFHRRVILLTEGWVQLFSHLFPMLLSLYPWMLLERVSDNVDLAGTVNTSSRKEKKKNLCLYN